MGRPPRFDRQAILEAARGLAREGGPAAVTVTGVAEALGAPSGSIYHRFPSRDHLVAGMWLETVARFQAEAVPRLAADGDPLGVAAAVAGWVVEWAARHPDDAALLASGRRQEILTGEFPPELVAEARRLSSQLDAAFEHLANRLGREVGMVVLAVAGIPHAAIRTYLTAGEAIPAWVSGAVTRAARAVLASSEEG